MKIFNKFISLLLMLLLTLGSFCTYAEDFAAGTIKYSWINTFDGEDIDIKDSFSETITGQSDAYLDLYREQGSPNGALALNIDFKRYTGDAVTLAAESKAMPTLTFEKGIDYIFTVDFKMTGGTAIINLFRYKDTSNANKSMMIISGKELRDAGGEKLPTSYAISMDKEYKLRLHYRGEVSGSSVIGKFQAAYIEDNGMITKLPKGKYSSSHPNLPSTISVLGFASKAWGSTKKYVSESFYADNFGVKAVDTSLNFDTALSDANPYKDIDISFSNYLASGTVSLKDGDKLIASDGGKFGVKELTLNHAEALEFGKEYTVSFDNVTDIFGNVINGEYTLKTLTQSDMTASSDVDGSSIDKMNILLKATPSQSDLDNFSFTGSGAAGTAPVDTIEVKSDAQGNERLHITLSDNLKTNTTYTVTMPGMDSFSFTTKDGINVSRAKLNGLSSALPVQGTNTVRVNVDNSTYGGTRFTKAALMVLHYEADELKGIALSSEFNLTDSIQSLEASVNIPVATANTIIKSYVTDGYMGMFPLAKGSSFTR